jgi:hypothetical protein
MRRPHALPLLLASAALLVLAGGCTSSPKRTATAGGAGAGASAPAPAGSAGSPAPGTAAGAEGSPAPHASPGASVKVPSGTVSYGWITGTSGTSVRVAMGVRYTNTATNKAATKYLQSHGGGSVPAETPVTHVDVDLGTMRTLPISPNAVVVTTAKGGAAQQLNVTGFLAWLKTHFAKPLPVSMRQSYQGAPRYGGPLWMLTVRGGVIVAIGQLST